MSEPAQGRLRILLVSQMYPGRDAPELGIFVARIAAELERQGHLVERVVIDRRRRSPRTYAALVARATRAARSFRPDVVYGHMLFPAGVAAAAAAAAARAPYVLTAHGTDVANAHRSPALAAATRLATARAFRVIAVSRYLQTQLVAALPQLAERVEVIDSGVDLDAFRPRDGEEPRRSLGWHGPGPHFLFVGSLNETKNVLRLVEALHLLGEGRLAVLGDGPLRDRLEGDSSVRIVGRVPPGAVADWIAACDVLCQPSLAEGFGQAVLEAMASGRSVVATRVGGPAEFVTPAAGALVDPLSVAGIAAGMRMAASLPQPNLAARAAAAEHDVRLQAARIADVLAAAVAGRRRR